MYIPVNKYSKKKFNNKNFLKNKLISYLNSTQNNLQIIVEKKYPVISRLLFDIKLINGCIISRMTGSGSVCYGLFKNYNCSKAALKKLRKKYPKFSFSIAKTI